MIAACRLHDTRAGCGIRIAPRGFVQVEPSWGSSASPTPGSSRSRGGQKNGLRDLRSRAARMVLLLLALTLTMSEPVANHGGNAQAEAAGPGECTFAQNPACTGGFNIQCAEIDSSTHPGYKEEFVCCPAISQFVDRICLGPGVMTPCGMTGPRGCAVCS